MLQKPGNECLHPTEGIRQSHTAFATTAQDQEFSKKKGPMLCEVSGELTVLYVFILVALFIHPK